MDQLTDAPPQTAATGLAMIQAVFASGGFKRGLGTTLGITGREATEGRVVLVGSPTQDHYNPLGSVHGGYAATMLDAAIALALQTLLPTGTGYGTTDLNITYLRPLTVDSGPVRAEGTIIHLGRSMALGEARVLDREDLLCAHAKATFVIRRSNTEASQVSA